MKRKQKWTHGLRVKLYELLMVYHGKYKYWGKVTTPGKNNLRESKYPQTLKKIAEHFSETEGVEFSPLAVQQQVNFAITKQKTLETPFRLTQLQNVVAALEVGFLENSHLEVFNNETPEAPPVEDVETDADSPPVGVYAGLLREMELK